MTELEALAAELDARASATFGARVTKLRRLKSGVLKVEIRQKLEGGTATWRWWVTPDRQGDGLALVRELHGEMDKAAGKEG